MPKPKYDSLVISSHDINSSINIRLFSICQRKVSLYKRRKDFSKRVSPEKEVSTREGNISIREEEVYPPKKYIY